MKRKKLLKNEVVKMFNTTSETLRYYEKEGLLTPEIKNNNYRYYDFFDLQRLRQIILFRDLNLSIDEIKSIYNNQIEESEYISMLKTHQRSLFLKIQRLKEVYDNVGQLLELVTTNDLNYSFSEKVYSKRWYYVLDPIDSDVMSSPKAYYEKFSNIINNKYYSEESLNILYDYEALGKGSSISSKICFEIPHEIVDAHLISPDVCTAFESGRYLSVFYQFIHGDFESLSILKEKIEKYLNENDLELANEYVFEIEHPELSLFLEDEVSIFELQVMIYPKENK